MVGSKETGLEVNADKTNYMVMSWDPNAVRSHKVKTDNSSFERVEHLKCYWTILSNQNCIQQEINKILKSGNACCHSIQNLMSSSLLSKSMKNKIYSTIILPVVLSGRETCSRALWEERRLRVFENRALRRIFGPKGDEVTREWIQLYNDLYTLLNIIRVVKWRRMSWAVHVAHLGEGRIAYRV